MVGNVSRRRIVAVDEYEAVSVLEDNVYVHDAEEKIGALTGRMFTKEHKLDLAFGPEDDNEVVFGSVAIPMVDYVLRGGTACCIAYGQTGSGKTHTQSSLQMGAAHELLKNLPHGAELFVSFFENCGDANYDLLSGAKDHHDETLPVREDAEGNMHVVGLTEAPVANADELQAILSTATQRRATASTLANDTSSRSHAICTFTVSTGGSLRVVDLAGSERREDMVGHDMERIEEMKEINWSLGCLKQCIHTNLQNAKAKGAKAHVPYRNSKLTMLLRDCLEQGDGVLTCFISHVAPLASALLHTRNTLDYTMAMIQISQLEAEKKKFVGPDQWSLNSFKFRFKLKFKPHPHPNSRSKAKFNKWVEELDGGRFKKLCPMKYSGKLFAIEDWQDFNKNVRALGRGEPEI